LNHQIFLKDFFRNFSEPFFLIGLAVDSGCKGKNLFPKFQIFFEDFFSGFCQNLFCITRTGLSTEAGAKVRTFSESANLF